MRTLKAWVLGIVIGFVLGWLASSYSDMERQGAPQGFSAPDAPITAYFAPSSGPQQAILQTLQRAEKFVHVAIYQLTDPQIAQELITIPRRGIELKILLDGEPSKGSKGCLLLSEGLEVKEYKDSGIMHHKFAVVDGTKVITGSYNWTTSAQTRNEENLLVIASPELAQAFEAEFLHLWNSPKAQRLTGC